MSDAGVTDWDAVDGFDGRGVAEQIEMADDFAYPEHVRKTLDRREQSLAQFERSGRAQLPYDIEDDFGAFVMVAPNFGGPAGDVRERGSVSRQRGARVERHEAVERREIFDEAASVPSSGWV